MSLRLGWPKLIAITDLTALAENELVARLERLAHAAAPGSVALLLRDHDASGQRRWMLGQRLRDAARAAGQALWVADRVDLALLLQADALHLGEGSVSANVARRLVGDGVGVSRAWHAATLDDVAAESELGDVDALLVSPVLAARKGRPALGLGVLGGLGEQLRARNRACHLYALGGVSAANAGDCLRAGAAGVAAIGAALDAEPRALLSALASLR